MKSRFSERFPIALSLYLLLKPLTVSGVSGDTTAEGIGKFSLAQQGDNWTGLLLKEPVYANRGQKEALDRELTAIKANDVRCKPMKRFPFLIMFTIDEQANAVNILRIFNTCREPLY